MLFRHFASSSTQWNKLKSIFFHDLINTSIPVALGNAMLYHSAKVLVSKFFVWPLHIRHCLYTKRWWNNPIHHCYELQIQYMCEKATMHMQILKWCFFKGNVLLYVVWQIFSKSYIIFWTFFFHIWPGKTLIFVLEIKARSMKNGLPHWKQVFCKHQHM